jgi:hypothetical protein
MAPELVTNEGATKMGDFTNVVDLSKNGCFNGGQ